MADSIIVRGAREHNLKGIDVKIPRHQLVVITGLSGSGKSSLAFDTIYAEGQRRYVESLSAYARQFLGQMKKPEVDHIEGLSPAISIDQKTTSRNPRSTVGTTTEIYDYLRLLWAHVGTPHCHLCGRGIGKMGVDQIVDEVLALPEGTRIQVLAPVVRDRKGEYVKLFKDLKAQGFVRVRVDGTVGDVSDPWDLDRNYRHTVEAIVDRLVVKDGIRERLADAIETSFKAAEGLVTIWSDDGKDAALAGPGTSQASKSKAAQVAAAKGPASGTVAAMARTSAGTKGRSPPPKSTKASARASAASAKAAKASAANAPVEAAPPQRPGADGKGTGTETLYSEAWGCPEHGAVLAELTPRMFSFNAPQGACPKCSGLGASLEPDPGKIIRDPLKSVEKGAFHHEVFIFKSWMGRWLRQMAKQFDIDLTQRWVDMPEAHQEIILYGAPEATKIKYGSWSGESQWEGLAARLTRLLSESESDRAKERIQGFMAERPCSGCKGLRLRPEVLAVSVDGQSITGSTKMAVTNALQWYDTLPGRLTPRQAEIGKEILKEIVARLRFLENVGLGYLSLDRASSTLSGGESQRIRLASQIGSGLQGVLYVLDEPSIGLHQRDNHKLLETLQHLKSLDNTVLVVEHDNDTMRAADYLIDLGPGAGEHGGHLVAFGTPAEVANVKASLTGQYLAGTLRVELPRSRRAGNGKKITIMGARENNLKDVTVALPLGEFVAVTGVSGSGKSTLINETLYKGTLRHLDRVGGERPGAHKEIRGLENVDKVIDIDQSPIGRTPRSNPATYTGVWTPIRELFAMTSEAKQRGYKPGRFSFNVKGGRCEACQGDGVVKIEMHFLPDVYVPCEVCKGARYNKETLQVRYKGKNIREVLDLSVEEALGFFGPVPAIRNKMQTLFDVGLGYIRLGQPATQLSGGEAQRVKLATELSKRSTGRTLYILDEPTTGLHIHDIKHLLDVLQRLVDTGNTVVVIEHNLDVIKCADWVIDLGPEGGDAGGYVIAEGTPEEIAVVDGSYTGRFLRPLLEVPIAPAARRKR